MKTDKIQLKAINHLTYTVTNKTNAAKFWKDILGVEAIPKQVDSENLIWLQLPSGGMIHLIENPDAPSIPSHHGAFEVDDIEACAESIKSKGIKIEGPISTRKDGQRAFYISDEDGNRIEICTKSNFGILVN